MPDKLSVMISSTSKDLEIYRKAVGDAVYRCSMDPLMMEKDPADDTTPLDYSLGLVDKADIYVGIFAHRYGFCPKENNPNSISMTEMEYRYAVKRGIPILIYLIKEDHPFKPTDIEKGKGATKLKRLKKELKDKHRLDEFTTPEDLALKIMHGLNNLKSRDAIKVKPPIARDPADTGLPQPPDAYVAHPYILTQTFFGRREELKLLDEWATSDDSTLVVEAIGGVGKSALTWEWFKAHTQKSDDKSVGAQGLAPEFEAALWWSFYESDSAVSNFTRHALAYLTGHSIDHYNSTPPDERERLLLAELDKRPVLLVLDGIERIMVAYHRIDAPQVLDEQVEDPGKTASGSVNLRACTDPRHGEFLRKLTACKTVKILVSTRLFPADLQNKAGQTLPRVRHLHLNGLQDADALALMTHLGVTGDSRALTTFMRQFDNHSLLLTVIAGRIHDYRPAPGNFDRWHADEGRALKLIDVEMAQRRSNILQYALDGLPPELRKLLGQAAAFRYPVDYTALSALNPYLPPKPDEVEEPDEEPFSLWDARWELEHAETDEERADAQKKVEAEEKKLAEAQAAYQKALHDYLNSTEYKTGQGNFHTGLKELEDRGLLLWDRLTNQYDLHPVVRAYAYESLLDDDRRGAFAAIRSHFEALPPVEQENVKDLGDLRRDLEIYYALTRAGLLDEASRFYDERLRDVLVYQIAAYHSIIELLTPLFPAGIDGLPALSDPAQQSYRLTDLANAFYLLGRNDESLVLKGLKLKLDLERRAAPNLGVGLRNYTNSLDNTNQLAAALRTRELARDLAEAAEDTYGLPMAQLFLLSSYVDIGDWGAAEVAYQNFSDNPPTTRTTFWQADAERYYAEMLLVRGDDPTSVLDKAWNFAVQNRDPFTIRIIHSLRGEVALAQGKPDEASAHFQDAIALARKSGGADLATYQGCLARAWVKMGRWDDARGEIESALAQPYKDELHNIYNSAAEVYLILGETETAKDYALQAYEWAWADGPPYSWWWELERAKKVLDALRVPYPTLPPFDPAKVQKIPYQDEIRAFIAELKTEKAAEEDSDNAVVDFDDDT